jgi:formylglycine-generating enzyme required for sulfatase activity
MSIRSRQLAIITVLAVGALASCSTQPAASGAAIPAARPSGAAFDDCAGAAWCPRMVVVPAGSFVMGAVPGEAPASFVAVEGPRHAVRVRSFALGQFDVTRGEWAAFVTATHRPTTMGCSWSPRVRGGRVDSTASWRDPGFPQTDRDPVVCVTFDDAQDYARWLSARTGHHYRLPSEAEWEYAARAGTTTRYPWGDSASHEYANYGTDTTYGSGVARGRDRWIYTSPVGSFPPNAFGVYDMHGNVLQMVQDCFAPSYASTPTDGSAYEADVMLRLTGDLADLDGRRSCSIRGARGGDWADPPWEIRSAFRNFNTDPAGYRSTGVGFRVARDVE